MSQAICGPADGVLNDTPCEPGRVFASVTRRIFEPNVGSVMIEPAGPMLGSAGFGRAIRSDGDVYAVGTGDDAGGCAGAGAGGAGASGCGAGASGCGAGASGAGDTFKTAVMPARL